MVHELEHKIARYNENLKQIADDYSRKVKLKTYFNAAVPLVAGVGAGTVFVDEFYERSGISSAECWCDGYATFFVRRLWVRQCTKSCRKNLECRRRKKCTITTQKNCMLRVLQMGQTTICNYNYEACSPLLQTRNWRFAEVIQAGVRSCAKHKNT